MKLIRRNNWPFLQPVNGLDDLFNMDRFFDSEWLRSQRVPAVNVKEEEKSYEIEVAAPGLSRDDFKVSVENGTLTISSEKEEEKEAKEENYTRKEFSYSSFTRSFSLPENVDENAVTARYEDGVLKVSLGKTENAKIEAAKQIAVK